MIDSDDRGHEHPSRARVRASARAWIAYGLVVLPVVASFFVTLLLLVGLVFGQVVGGGIGGAIGGFSVPFVVTAWQLRPGGREGSSEGLSPLAAVSSIAAFAAADAATVAIVAATGRLPRWTLVLAVASLVIHLGLGLVVVLRRDRIRQVDDEPQQSTGEPARKVRWRETPEPLRSVTGLTTAATAVALGAFVLNALDVIAVESPVLRWAGLAWGASIAVLGIVTALNLGGSAEFSARRNQTRRQHRGLWATEDKLVLLRRWLQASGLVIAASGALIAWVFWAER